MKTKHYLIGLLSLPFLFLQGCSDANRQLELADKEFNAGDYDKAEIHYLNLLKKKPGNPHIISQLALLNYEEGRFGRAGPLLLKARELEPENLQIRSKLAQAYFSASDLKQAREEALFILNKDPYNDEALLVYAETATSKDDFKESRKYIDDHLQSNATSGLFVSSGVLNFRQSDFKAAEADMQKALSMDEKVGAAYSILSLISVAQKDLAKAELNLKKAADVSPVRSTQRLQYASFKLQSKAYDEARQYVSDILKSAPDFIPALIAKAEIELAADKYDDCKDIIERIFLRDPGNDQALFISARLKMKKNEIGEAIKDLEKYTSMHPQYVSGLHQLASAYLAQGDGVKALATVSKAVTLNPNYTPAKLLLSELQIGRGDINPAISNLRELIQKDPSTSTAYFLLANAYVAQKKYEDALGMYQILIRGMPNNPEPHFLAGMVYVQKNMKVEARQEFEKVLTMDTKNALALEQLVNLDLVDKKYKEAEELVNKQADPKSADLHLFLAKIYAEQKQYKPCEAELLKAIEIQPDSRASYFLLAKMYVESNQVKQGIETLEKIVKKNPQDTSALMLIGMIYEQNNQFNEAKEAYERVLKIKPDFSVALNNLASIYCDHEGKLDEAQALIQKAKEPQPNDPYVNDTLGWVLYKKGDYKTAFTLFQATAPNLPRNPQAQFHLAAAAYMMGQLEVAKPILEVLSKYNKDFTGKNEAQKMLLVLQQEKENDSAKVREVLSKNAQLADDPVANRILAKFYEKEGNYTKAAESYEKVLARNPAHLDALISLASLNLQQLKNENKAMDYANAAYKINPDNETVQYLVGLLAYRTGQYKWALSLLQQRVKKNPSPEVQYDLAQAYFANGFIPEALDAGKAAMNGSSSKKKEAEQFCEIATLILHPENIPSQEEKYKALTRNSPDNVPARMIQGLAAARSGSGASAEGEFQFVLSRMPDFIPAKLELAKIYSSDKNQAGKAVEYANQILSTLPDNPDALSVLTKASYFKGQYDQCISYAERLTAKLKSGEVLCYLGLSQYKLNRLSESKVTLEKAIGMVLPDDLTREAKETLKAIQSSRK